MRRMQDFRKTLRTQPLNRTYALTGKIKRGFEATQTYVVKFTR